MQSKVYPWINWGDGFVADPAYIAQTGISNPNSFLSQLLDKPYLKQVSGAWVIISAAFNVSNDSKQLK